MCRSPAGLFATLTLWGIPHRGRLGWLPLVPIFYCLLFGCASVRHFSTGMVNKSSDGKLFVTGLERNSHGFVRGARLLLDAPLDVPGSQDRRIVAVAAVVESYSDTVHIQILCQRAPGSLLGCRARSYDPATQRLFAGRCAGSVLERRGGRVHIDLGSQDQVEVGSRYRILDHDRLEERGIIRVTEVHDQSSWAEITGDPETVYPGQDVVFHQDAQAATRSGKEPLLILVVPFAPSANSDMQERKLGESAAWQLSQALSRAAGESSGIKVQYASDAIVRPSAYEPDSHAQARAIGLTKGAHLVVWGVAQCSEKACLIPRFTVVDPAKLQRSEVMGMRLPVQQNVYGFVLNENQVPTAALELAAAIIGQLAYKGQKYADAAYYLQRAMQSPALAQSDDFRMQQWAAESLFILGQMENAAVVAGGLVGRAKKASAIDWQLQGLEILSKVELETNQVEECQQHLDEMLRLAVGPSSTLLRAFALNQKATLVEKQGRLAEAKNLYQQSLELKQQLGDRKGVLETRLKIADLEVAAGMLEQGRQEIEKVRTDAHQGKLYEIEANALQWLGRLAAKQGQTTQAVELLLQAKTLYERLSITAKQLETEGHLYKLLHLPMSSDQGGDP